MEDIVENQRIEDVSKVQRPNRPAWGKLQWHTRRNLRATLPAQTHFTGK
jgi:hypothetical protein